MAVITDYNRVYCPPKLAGNGVRYLDSPYVITRNGMSKFPHTWIKRRLSTLSDLQRDFQNIV